MSLDNLIVNKQENLIIPACLLFSTFDLHNL